jgi:hypothetical protein
MTDDGQGQDERLAEIRALHFENADDPDVCYECGREWPCDEAYVVARLDALTAERAAIQAAWNRDRSLLDVAIDHHMSRWKQAEAERDDALARLAAAEAALQNIVAVLGPAACACEGQQVEVDTALGYARAALAGSREQAQGDGA